MNTKLRKKSLTTLFEFDTPEERIRNNAEVLMFRFLSEVERLMIEAKMNRKELAEKLGTSPSYVTQLFRGTKLLNFLTVAKLEVLFGIKFRVKAYSESGEIIVTKEDIKKFIADQRATANVVRNLTYSPEYDRPLTELFEKEGIQKIAS